MQPIHSLEARWFWEWDRAELARGIGISLFMAGIFFLVAGSLVEFFTVPLPWIFQMVTLGALITAIMCCLDSFGKPHCDRRLRCRRCKAVSATGKIMARGWKCGKCGTLAKFDNLD